MTKVYLLTRGEYSDYSVRGVFSSEEKIMELFEGDESRLCFSGYCIEEFELDQHFDEKDKIYRKYFSARIAFVDHDVGFRHPPENVKAGEIFDEEERFGWALPTDRGAHCLSEAQTGTQYLPTMTEGWVRSYVSKEHAQKLCAECRQTWLSFMALRSKEREAQNVLKQT